MLSGGILRDRVGLGQHCPWPLNADPLDGTGAMFLCRKRALLFVAAVLALACDRAWDAANRGAATADVKALLAAHGAPDVTPECKMAGVSRNVECIFDATVEDAMNLVSGLSLRPVDSSSSLQDGVGTKPTAVSGCVEAFRGGPNVRLYGVTGRPPQLRLAGGSAFEFLLLYHDVSASRACVQLSYAYG